MQKAFAYSVFEYTECRAAELSVDFFKGMMKQNMNDTVPRRWVIKGWNSLFDEDSSGRKSLHLW